MRWGIKVADTAVFTRINCGLSCRLLVQSWHGFKVFFVKQSFMKKQLSGNISTVASLDPGKVKPTDSKVRKLLSKTKRYIYTEQDLGEDRLHMGITAAAYAALSATF